MFDLDLVKSTITILYVKMPLADALVYAGAAWGAWKNYRKNCEIVEKQQHANVLKEGEAVAKKKQSRKEYILEKAKYFFWEVEKVARATKMKGDDKLFDYVRSFAIGMNTVFGDAPTEEDIKLMHEKAFELDMELKAKEGKLSEYTESDVE